MRMTPLLVGLTFLLASCGNPNKIVRQNGSLGGVNYVTVGENKDLNTTNGSVLSGTGAIAFTLPFGEITRINDFDMVFSLQEDADRSDEIYPSVTIVSHANGALDLGLNLEFIRKPDPGGPQDFIWITAYYHSRGTGDKAPKEAKVAIDPLSTVSVSTEISNNGRAQLIVRDASSGNVLYDSFVALPDLNVLGKGQYYGFRLNQATINTGYLRP